MIRRNVTTPGDGKPDAAEPLRLADALLSRPGQLTVEDRDTMRRRLEAAGAEKATEETVAHLVEQLGGVHDTRAITMLVWLGPASVQPLIDVLRDPAKGLQAALALGYIRDPRAIDPLHARMLEGTSTDMQRAAAWALGTLGDPAAANALLIAHHRALAEAESEQPKDEAQPEPAPEPEQVTEQQPPLSIESLGSLDFDGLAEYYDIALEAWRSAGHTGDLEQEKRWHAITEAVVAEAKRRPAGDGDAGKSSPWQATLLNRRRVERQRAQLREACAQTD